MLVSGWERSGCALCQLQPPERNALDLLVRNLGRITEADIKIRPLTVFVGPNGTNKTWTAYAFYALAQAASRDFFHLDTLARIDRNLKARIDETFIKFVESLAAQAKKHPSAISQTIERTALFDGIPSGAELRLQTMGLIKTLKVAREHLRGSQVSLRISEEDLKRNQFRSLALLSHPEAKVFEMSLRAEKPPHSGHFFRAEGGPEQIKDFLPPLLTSLAIGVYEGVFALPSERKALSSFFDVLKPEFSKVATKPAAEFVELLQRAQVYSRHTARTRTPQFRLIAEKFLEGNILGGSVEFEEGEGGLSFRSKNHPPLAMHVSASLTKSLSGLDVYLKNFARAGDLLVIDEPEMNAHPDAQIKIIELLSILVNQGIHVLITTHSPYVADHLNNLVHAHSVPHTKRAGLVREFALGNSQSFINPDQLSVYFFQENGIVADIFDRDRNLVDVKTFADATDRIGSIYSRLAENEQ